MAPRNTAGLVAFCGVGDRTLIDREDGSADRLGPTLHE